MSAKVPRRHAAGFFAPDASDAGLLDSVLWKDRMGVRALAPRRHSALFEMRERLAILGN